jgi:hypothetical protein
MRSSAFFSFARFRERALAALAKQGNQSDQGDQGDQGAYSRTVRIAVKLDAISCE